MECMGVASGCGEQEVGVASASGWNLWVWLLGVVVMRYRRIGFNSETLIIANCEIISSSQELKRKQIFTQSKSRGLVLHLQTVSSFQFSVLRRYFKPANKLPQPTKPDCLQTW